MVKSTEVGCTNVESEWLHVRTCVSPQQDGVDLSGCGIQTGSTR